MTDDVYEIHAVKYAHHARLAARNFLTPDPHDVGDMPLDYFVWAIVGRDRTMVLDTGYDAAVAKKRGRELIRTPAEGLRAIGVDAATVPDVILSHMHFDHAGNHAMFPAARYHVQDREMAFCTGRCMCHTELSRTFEAEDVTAMVGRVFQGRAQFHDGAGEIAPGITVHHVGGHSLGLQVVRVRTRRGWVVLASDATHFYANYRDRRPFAVATDVPAMLEAFTTLHRLASSDDHIVPGHDPKVMELYPASGPGLEGIAVRLDADPRPG
ncbi:glyoxylase-like metal-dependent hydrolase (beta-lactamase superfamily II) [Humitalea rosea]|uniref:Glyoxylase-like metal-dependent hydrolase (Beta-lactamase superfamily II) n=1 Tax=Humitalea rosea TaxID=990373 RepID=A0A2W7I0C0_9PROT|nr:N-acyl homoserine lactonase family protein [Humitalea rosea]PZW38902.1 glyoxylase-like metal-dependent hydrolase (beta-lactamase superfamily II) [Humitalea rosea]